MLPCAAKRLAHAVEHYPYISLDSTETSPPFFLPTKPPNCNGLLPLHSFIPISNTRVRLLLTHLFCIVS